MKNIPKQNETMEDVIRELESSFDTVQDIAPVAYWYEKLNESGKIESIHFSGQLRTMLGYSIGEFPNDLDGFIKIVHPEDIEEC